MSNPNPPAVQYDFFIAHAHPAAARALELYTLLCTEYRVFLDARSLEVGSNWAADIPAAQAASLVTVVLICNDFNAAYYAQEEVNTAIFYERTWGKRHRVLPIFLDGTPASPDGIPYGLRCRFALDVRKEGGLERIAARLKSVFLGEAPAPAPLGESVRHPLLNFPPGPAVPAHVISTGLIQDYARLIRQHEALQVIAEANAFRLEVASEDPYVSYIKDYQLLPVYTVAPYAFWLDAFKEARLHGPRMLAALLMVVPDALFDPRSQENRRKLLETILREPM